MQNLQAKKKKYAELIIQFGLNLQQGQNLLIKAPIDAFDVVKLVAEEAYNAGVDQIFYQWRSDELDLLKYQKASVASFGKPLQRLEDGYATELKKIVRCWPYFPKTLFSLVKCSQSCSIRNFRREELLVKHS